MDGKMADEMENLKKNKTRELVYLLKGKIPPVVSGCSRENEQ